MISGVGTGDITVTRHPPGIPVTLVTPAILMMWQLAATTTPHKRDATAREEVEGNTGVGVTGTPTAFLLILVF